MKALLLTLAISGSLPRMASAADVFESAPSGRTSLPAAPRLSIPANVPQLSLARPYAVIDGDNGWSRLDVDATAAPAEAGDWYTYWSVSATASPSKVEDRKRAWGIRGRIVAVGDLGAVVSFGAAADHPGIMIAPRVTGDAAVNRYGVGFTVRLASDLIQRVPLPTLNLSKLDGADVEWIPVWVDECIRNGVAGIRTMGRNDPTIAQVVDTTLSPLRGPNVYLPPASEAAILVPELNAAAPEVFRCYAGLRASGVWPNFVSEEQLAARSVSLARYRVLVLPLAVHKPAHTLVEDAARRGAIVVAMGGVDGRPARVLASGHDGRPAITRRTLGDGCWIAAKVAPWSADGAWTGFWEGVLGDAGVPRRPWVEAVTAANVGLVTGKYIKPAPAK